MSEKDGTMAHSEILPVTHEHHDFMPADIVEADRIRSEALATDSSAVEKGYFTSIRMIGTFAGISFSLTATYFLFEAAAGVITTINDDIGPSENASLFTIVWSVAQPISILLFGRLSDRFGRRNLAIGGNLIGIIGAIVGATAKTMNTMVGAMVLLGLAAGPIGSYPLLTGELATNKAKFLATVSVVVPNIIATGFAPYIGLRLVAIANWRWIYYIYIMMNVPGTTLWFFFYHPPSYVQLHGKEFKKRDELKRTDFVGIFLLVAGLTLFLLGISWGGTGTNAAWDSARILGLLISGGICCFVFVMWEIFGKVAQPVIPMRFFKDVRGFACIVIISAVTGCINVALFIVWPSQVLHIFGTSNKNWEQTAWMSCTINFGLWTGIIIFGPLFSVMKHIRWQLIVGSAWMTVFLGVMSTIKANGRNSAIAVSFLTCLPVGWGEIITMLLVQYVVEDADLGVGFAVVSASRGIVGSIFTSIFVAILTNKLPGELKTHLIPAVEKAGLPAKNLAALLVAVASGSQTAIKAVPGVTPSILAAANRGASASFAGAYAYVYYAALALGIVSTIAACCTRDFDRYLTNHVSRQIYHVKETKKDVLELIEEKKTVGEA